MGKGLFAAVVLVALAQAAKAELLPEGQDWREIPFEVVDEKPLLAARIGEASGRMMFDTGTPEALFLNRDALALSGGQVVGNGFAASGQAVEVQVHPAPKVEIGGLPFATGPVLVSGNFGFTEPMFGADYFGFVGAPSVAGGAFVLDYARGILTVLRTDGAGALAVPPPAETEILARLSVAMVADEMPTAGAFIGSLPVVLEFDTGDSGTLYLQDATRARLEAEGLLTVTDAAGTLSQVSFGGARFDGLEVGLVQAGGPSDKRSWPGSDALRLGAGFLADHPTLWNAAAGTLTVLRPEAAFLAPR